MKVNWLGILGVLLLVLAACFGYFGETSTADLVAVASATFGAGVLILTKWKAAGTRLGKAGLAVAGVGGLLIGFAGFAESLITTVIIGVVGALGLIIGLIVAKKTAT